MHGGGANADAPDLAVEVGHLDGVADLDGALDEQDDPRDEVVHDGLKAEAHPDPERTREQGEAVEVEAEGADGHREAQEKNQVVEEARDRVGQAPPHGQAWIEILFQSEADEARDEEGGPDGHDQGEDIAQGDAHESVGHVIAEDG